MFADYDMLPVCIILLILVSFISIESYIAIKIRSNKKYTNMLGDDRLNIIYDMIYGIKTVKLTGISDFISNKVDDSRNKELKGIWKGKCFEILNDIIGKSVTVLITIVTVYYFLFYKRSENGSYINSGKLFASLSIINIMSRPIHALPKSISLYSNFLVSLERIHNIMILSNNKSPNIVSYYNDLRSLKRNKIRDVELKNLEIIRQGHIAKANSDDKFHNSKFSLLIDYIKLNNPGLVVIIGENGHGKTTFLLTLMEELDSSQQIMYNFDNEVNNVENRQTPIIAYCSHESWIVRDTLRKNVVLGELSNQDDLYDRQQFEYCLRCTGLDHDFTMWPDADKTHLGLLTLLVL